MSPVSTKYVLLLLTCTD